MPSEYPKVLIIGETFHSNSGGGITLSNLFFDWPRECLANAVDFRNPSINREFAEVKYFELYEFKLIFNLLSHKYFKNLNSSTVSSAYKPGIKTQVISVIKKYIYILFEFLGIKHFIFTYKVDESFISWIKDFNPDFIYTQLSSRESIRLISDLHELTNIPVAIHIMDDWPSTISSKGFFKSYWNHKIDKEFRALLHKSSVFLSISEYMSEEYLKRYHKKFIPFHNPLELEKWENQPQKSIDDQKAMVFLHAGRTGKGINSSLLDVAKALQSIADENIKIQLQIQSSYIDIQLKNSLLKYNCVKILPAVEYKEIPEILKGADVLVLCNDFDEEGKNFLKFSMPTKASEYMISKVPILLFSPASSAIYRHAQKNHWAYLVGENNIRLLRKAMMDLIVDIQLRHTFAENAYMYARINFDCKKVREKFKNAFI